MLPLISLATILTLSMIVVRIGGVALMLTGMTHDAARFQALSAFTGAGFTTRESEQVVNHPVRRRVIAILLRLGNAGIISALASVIFSFTGVTGGRQGLIRVGAIVGILVGVWLISRSNWLDRHMSAWIRWALRRWTDLDVTDYANLLKLTSGYMVTEIFIGEEESLTEQSLGDLRLSREGLNVIAVRRRSGQYVPAPTGRTVIKAGDTLTVYAHRDAIAAFEEKRHQTPEATEEKSDAAESSAEADQAREE